VELTPLAFSQLFEEFRQPSWQAWRSVLAQITPDTRELFIAAGRGGGKSRVAALLLVWACTRRYKRAVGERVYLSILAPDRRQAAVTMAYAVGLLQSRPELERLIANETQERIELVNGCVLEVVSATKSAPRGRSYGFALIEESSFLPASDDAAADADVEVLRALSPALGRLDGSLLACIGSPYRRRGLLYDAITAGPAPDRVVVSGSTLFFNPSFSRKEVERAWKRDAVAARSEFGELDGPGIDFRSDISGLLSPESLSAVTPSGVYELVPGPPAVAHFDAATGSGADAAALAIAFRGAPVAKLALVRRWVPAFSPTAVIAEAAHVLRAFGLREIGVDRFAPGLIQDLFAEHRITATVADHDTSQGFIELLALINSQRVELLDHAVLLAELRQLERRAGLGRDRVSHPPNAHDDVAAACAGALLRAVQPIDCLHGKLVWSTSDDMGSHW
jgi:hypothetical protein